MENKYNISPFVKWAGGKRQLIDEITKRLPKTYNNYFEPFIGGGAVLFGIQPKKATINDINPQLINAYITIRNNVDELIDILSDWDKIECTKEHYYDMRNFFNKKIESKEFGVETAALFIYLNKRCFNGLYRVNSKGLFNVPFNNKTWTKSFSKDNLKEMSVFLRDIEIDNYDFEASVKDAKKGDFIFFDSPYAPINPDSFESYTKEGFSREDHIRLANLFKDLDKRGCYIMLTNHNTDFINELYRDYNIDVVKVKRLINRNADKRFGEEVIITNYD